jgi:putative FmdB family regulatory protein
MLALSVCECQLAEEYVPTYQYACTACDHRFDAVQSFSDPSLTTCPACSGKLRKIFSSVGIVFKGSGFYRTDSRAGAVVNGDAGPKEGGGKDGAGKDAGGKDGAPKEAAAKNGAGKDGASKESATSGSGQGGKQGAST